MTRKLFQFEYFNNNTSCEQARKYSLIHMTCMYCKSAKLQLNGTPLNLIKDASKLIKKER